MKTTKSQGATSGASFTVVHPYAAAIDIGAKFHVVAVGPEPVRSFGSFAQELHQLAQWLKQIGITTIAMESTGVYWIPAFEVLEAYGFEVVLVNARDARNVPGRKTDVSDAQWLQTLHAHGLLRASFRPRHDIATLRAYLRQRERLLEYAAAHIQHMQEALMQINLQLHHVVQDVTGATGMKIIRSIVAGERNPEELARRRDVRCKASSETIRDALVGNYQDEHVFELTQALALYDFGSSAESVGNLMGIRGGTGQNKADIGQRRRKLVLYGRKRSNAALTTIA
nr:transposase [Paraburkholderia hospita]